MMRTNEIKASFLKTLRMICLAWMVICPVFFIACNFLSPRAKIESDFMVSFYSAGTLLLSGRAAEIYPPPSCLGWEDSPINAFVHSTFPDMSPQVTANFMYSPLVAFLLAPWAALPPVWAITGWQFFNLILLGLSCVLLSKCTNNPRPVYLFALAVSYGPLIAALWVGQTSIAFGLAPLALATYLLYRRRTFASGLALSLLALKPQFFIISLALVCILPDRKKLAGGILSGLAALAALSLLTAPALLSGWLHSLKLSERYLGGGAHTTASYLSASLPSAILSLLDSGQRASSHFIIYGAALAAAATVLCFALRSGFPSQVNESNADTERCSGTAAKLACALFLAMIIEIICAPRLLLYDLSLMLAPLLLLANQNEDGYARSIAVASIAATDMYVLACMTTNINPLLLTGLLLLSSTLAFRHLNCSQAGRSNIDK